MIIKTILEGLAIVLLLVGFAHEEQIAQWENKWLTRLFGGEEK